MDLPAARLASNSDGIEIITHALERKRVETDREIAEFIAIKEKEYVVFEKQLRIAHVENLTVGHVANDHSSAGPGRLAQGLSSDAVIGSFLDSLGVRFSVGTSNYHHEATNLSPGKMTPGNISIKKRPSFNASEFHERELEFHGLFTPSYLPLLDSYSRKQRDWPKQASLNLLIHSNDRLISIRHSTSTSSAASFPPSAMSSGNSPLATNPSLSASVPREQLRFNGRSSSRSDLMVTALRSSLRDPKQPRLPKRVLFSLDNNILVAPSTSPIAQKKSSPTPPAQGPEINNVQRGFDKTATEKGKEPHMDGGSSSNSTATSAKNPSTSTPSPASPPAADPNGFQTRSTFRLINPLVGNEGVDLLRAYSHEDQLFPFDEEMTFDLDDGTPYTLSTHQTESETGTGTGPGEGKAEKTSPGGSEDGDDADDDAESKERERGVNKQGDEKETPGSPHAGSLPIEIKWPTTTLRDHRRK